MSRQSLVERYRPKSLDDVVGQPLVVKKIRNLMNKKDGINVNLLFIGPPGTGKTTVARCISREMQERHASDWPGSDFFKFHYFTGRNLTLADIRGKITQLTEFVGKRIVFIDEADGLDPQDQEVLATIMEGGNAIFILSSNNDKLQPKIKSRCTSFKFKAIKSEDIYNRLVEISKKEGLLKSGTPPIINQFYRKLSRDAQGDLRSAINELESYISNGQLDTELVEDYVEG